MTLKNRRAITLAVELLVVVLGVLIALAADSWWATRADEARAEQYLRSIQADAVQAEADLAETISALETLLTGLEEFRAVVEAEEPAPASMTLPPTGLRERFYAPTGMIRALLMTGDINLIAPTTRATLIGAEAEIQQRIMQSERFADMIVTAFRDLDLPMRRLAVAGQGGPSGRITAAQVQRSPEARYAIRAFIVAYGNQLGEHLAMRDAFEEIRSAVERDLGVP